MINYLPEYELYHHGIKGQRWGVRRFQNRDGTYTPLGRNRRSDDYQKRDYTEAKRVAKNVAKGVAKGIGAAALITAGAVAASAILSSPAGKKAITSLAKTAADPKTKEKIVNAAKRKALRSGGAIVDGAMAAIGGVAVATLVSKIDTSTRKGQVASRAASEGVRELTRTNFRNANFGGSKVDRNSKEYQALFKDQNGNLRPESERKEIKDRANNGASLSELQAYAREQDEKLNHSDELYHHGIKGQKWGVRRFQNKDGSLKPAGRERYGDGPPGSPASSNSSSFSGKSKKPGLFSPDNPNAERNKKIAKAIAITAGVAGVSAVAFCAANRVNSGMKEANKLISNEELRKHLMNEAQYHRDTMKDLMERDRTKKIDVKYGAETMRDATLLRDKAVLNQKEWNLNMAKQHYDTAARQLAEGKADKRLGKYISKVEAANLKSKQKAAQQEKAKNFQQAQYLLKQVAYQQGSADSKMYSGNKSYADNARKGRERLEELAKDPSIASMLKSYASSVNLPGMKELADDVLRKKGA